MANKNGKSEYQLVCATWNIKRGLIKREAELVDLINKEKVDIKLLTETDTKQLSKEDDFRIPGFTTHFHTRKNNTDTLRQICSEVNLPGEREIIK